MPASTRYSKKSLAELHRRHYKKQTQTEGKELMIKRFFYTFKYFNV